MKIILPIIAVIFTPILGFIIIEKIRGQSWKEIIMEVISVLPFL